MGCRKCGADTRGHDLCDQHRVEERNKHMIEELKKERENDGN